MSQNQGVDRRAFLRNAGMTALAGTVATRTSVAKESTTAAPESSDEFDFDEVYDRVGTHCSKWDRRIAEFGEENIQVGMGIADMDFRAAPCITRAINERCKHENWGYYWTPPTSLIDAIVSWNKRRYGLEIEPEMIEMANSVHPAMIASLRAFAPPGSKVLMSSPIYSAFYTTDLMRTKTIPADSPMKLTNGRYSIDFDDLESRISSDTHTLILCNPQNPTGNVWSKEDLLRIGRICLERRIVVLADEIHCDFAMKGHKYTPFASLPDKDVVNNSVTLTSAGKSFNLPGLRTAWFYSKNPEYLEKVKEHHIAQLNTIGVVANEAALTDGDDWLDHAVAYIDANHDYAESYIRDNIPLIDFVKPEGTFLAWLDVSKVAERIGAKQKAEEASESSGKRVMPEEILLRWFVENAKVYLNEGYKYGTGGANHMRMNVATSRKILTLALNNMAEALDKL